MTDSSLLLQLAAAVAALFGLGAVLVLLASRRSSPEQASRLWTVYLTEFLVLAIILVPAYFGVWPIVAVVLAIGLGAAREVYGALSRIDLNPWTRLGLAAGGLTLFSAAFVDEHVLHTLALLLGVALLGGRLLGPSPRPSPFRSGLATLFGVMYPCVFLAYLVLIARLPGAFGYIVFLFGLVEINDSTALLIGSLVGRRRLWPRVSPNKTVAGAVAGLSAAVGASLLLAFTVPALGTLQVVAGGALIALAAQAGDLFASAIKRRAGIKDFSKLVPAHGGVLDVYDALIFAAPIYYFYVRWATGA